MAEDKKAFVLYADLIHTVQKMPMEKRGELLTIILEYVNDLNPTTEDMIVDLVFEPIKRQMKRDLAKYEKSAERSRKNGKKGGRPPKPKGTQTNPKKPTGFSRNPDEPRKPDTVTVTVTDTVIDTVNDINKRGVFDKWIQYRKDIKKPITVEATLKALVKKFNETSFDKLDHVVNNSIENTYQGLIWDSYKGEQKKGKIKLSKLSF